MLVVHERLEHNDTVAEVTYDGVAGRKIPINVASGGGTDCMNGLQMREYAMSILDTFAVPEVVMVDCTTGEIVLEVKRIIA